MNNQTLVNAGFSAEQSEVYLSLLDHGPQTAISLAKTTKVKRTYVYKICQELANQNFITIEQKGRTTFFAPLSPNIIINKLSEKKSQIESAEIGVNNLLPSLLSKYRLIETKPAITYYEGIKGFQKVYDQIFRDKNDILLFRSTLDEKNKDLLNVVNRALENQVKLKIHTQTITPLVSDTKKTFLNLDQERLVNRHITRNPDFLLHSQIIIFGDKVAITSFKGEITSTIIDNKDIAQTFRQIFYIFWDFTQAEHEDITSSW